MSNPIRKIRWSLGAPIVASLVVGASAFAESDSCREWAGEHRRFKAVVVRSYLRGAPQRELDEAVFELLQREAYLTSCEQSVRTAREDLVGWRLVGRVPEEYASAVLESLLERAGFDVSLRSVVGDSLPVAVTSHRPGDPGPRRGAR